MLRIGQCAQDVIKTSNMHSQLSVKVVKVVRSHPFQREQFEEAQSCREKYMREIFPMNINSDQFKGTKVKI